MLSLPGFFVKSPQGQHWIGKSAFIDAIPWTNNPPAEKGWKLQTMANLRK